MKIGCFSDAHICAGDPHSNDRKMYSTLLGLLIRCDKVVVAGDFLEMYKRRGGRRRHFKGVAASYSWTFALISHHRDRFVFIEGNHDEGCLSMIPGVSPVEQVTIDGYRFFHGHQSDLHFAHRTMEKISESIIKFVFRVEAWADGWTKFRVSEWFSRWQNRSRAGVDRLAEHCREVLEKEPGLTGVVAGHTHWLDFKKMKTGQEYRNLGTYQDGNVFLLDTETGRIGQVWGKHGRAC